MAPTQTFHEHVAELRKRLLWVVMAVFISAGIGYNFRLPITRLLQHPLGAPLFYSSPAGSFNFVIQISMMIGIFVALPIMVYQLLRFIEPALPMRIKRFSMLSIITTSMSLAIIGAAFAFFWVVPTSLQFFGGYATDQIQPLISANEYLSFVVNSIVTFAIIFQIPLVFFFIDRIKPIKPSKLLKYQRHVIVAAFLIAVLLPFTYDPITQFVIATPIIFLYYLSIIILAFTNKRRGRRMPTNNKLLVTKPLFPSVAPPVQSFVSQSWRAAARPILSIDGFVSPAKQKSQYENPSIQVSKLHPPRNLSERNSNIAPARPKRQLSIDGFIRPMAV